MNAHNIADLRLLAKRRLPHGLFEYVDRGTENEVSMANNRRAYDETFLMPRPLVDVSGRSLTTTVLDQEIAAPLCVAPTGLAGLLSYEGEVAVARAAAEARIPFILSTASICPLELVAEKAGGNLWFQIYVWAKKEMSYELLRRAEAAGYHTLVVTVDSVVNSNREHNRRNGFTVPMRFNARNVLDGMRHPAWSVGVWLRYLATSGVPEFANFPQEIRTDLKGRAGKAGGVPVPKNEALTWQDIRAIREMWKGPMLVKGILCARDARHARDVGADGVVVSNHGARTLDGSVAPLQALSSVVDAVGSRMEVLCDSGIQRGSDIAKALALGAKAVLAGRAPLWGVAAGGLAGAAHALAILTTELDRVMAYVGCRSVAEIDAAILDPASLARLRCHTY